MHEASTPASSSATAPPAAKPPITLTAPKPAAPAAPGTPPAPASAPAAGTEGTPATDTKPNDAAGDAELIKQLTKASAAERRAQKLVEKLQADLKAATGTATEAQQQAALLAEIKKDPRKLAELGLDWDVILDAISGKPPEQEDPRLAATNAELKKLQEKIDAKEKAETEAKEKAARDRHESEVASARTQIQATIESEGVKPDADGLPRWAVVSQDSTAAQTAMDAVVAFIAENKLTVTDAEAHELVLQALDQMEAAERKRMAPLLAAQAARASSSVKSDTQSKASQPRTQPRAQLPPDRYQDATRRGRHAQQRA